MTLKVIAVQLAKYGHLNNYLTYGDVSITLETVDGNLREST